MELRVDNTVVHVALGISALAAVIGIGYTGFNYYRNNLSAHAHDIFMLRYTEYEKLVAENKAVTPELINFVSLGYQEYKKSAYGPFFLALLSELHASTGNKQEALEHMTQAVSQMSSVDSVVYHTYTTKLALMQLDAADPAIQTRGRQTLERLAMNNNNPMRDMAWFYLGYQALLDNDSQGVQTAWGRLFDAQRNPLSIWGVRAQRILNYTA